MKNDRFCFYFSVLDVHFVAAQYDWDVFAHTDQISMPVWYILVCHPCCDVKHDDGALPLDVVAVSKSTKLLLAGCVPHVESNRPSVCVEY